MKLGKITLQDARGILAQDVMIVYEIARALTELERSQEILGAERLERLLEDTYRTGVEYLSPYSVDVISVPYLSHLRRVISHHCPREDYADKRARLESWLDQIIADSVKKMCGDKEAGHRKARFYSFLKKVWGK